MADAPVTDAGWLSVSERGSVLGIQFFVWTANALGRAPSRFFLRFVALYYVIIHGAGRRAIRQYLERVQGRATLGMQYRHFLRFSEALLDRAFIASGKDGYFKVTRTGFHNLKRLRDERRGAILLGAHLGSFEALRMQSAKESLPLDILGHFSNARMLNAALEKINPKANARVIAIDDNNAHFALRIRDLVRAGHLIGILGDRVGPDTRAVKARFLGAEASFPVGPFMLAALLRCPIYLTFGLYHAPDRYDLYCEPFADEVILPRERRSEAVAEYAQKFADRLEHFVRLAPDNWFNFYKFWD
jgi:predicted LPLAT superfamily acyltransferase